MGACLSTVDLPDNTYIVRNILDDRHKGIIIVTAKDIKYVPNSGDERLWPLKYLRNYGRDRDVFSFDAGHECPGGEGLYAFSAKKVSQLFDMVARNIREGELLLDSEAGALSPPDGGRSPSHSPISLVPSPSPNPPPPPASNPPSYPPAHLPNYQNLNYQNGHLSGGRQRDLMGNYADVDLPITCSTPVPNKEFEFVQYSLVNFEIMEAIRKTKEEREEYIRLRMEEEARAEERKKEEEKLAEEKLAKKLAKKQEKKEKKEKKQNKKKKCRNTF